MPTFYGGGEYGNDSGESPWAGEITPSGEVTRVVITPNYSSSVTPSGTATSILVKDTQSVSGSASPAGTLSIFLNKFITATITPKTNDSVVYGQSDYGVTSWETIASVPWSNTQVNTYIDGLIKSTQVSPYTGSIASSGTVVNNFVRKKKVAGSITPSGSVSTIKYTMYSQSCGGEIDISATIDSEIADPNDIDRLIIGNAQKVLPRVKAYWSSGKFTSNLRGYSSSDIYQEKTLNLNPAIYLKLDETFSTSNNVALDSSENNYDGTYVGTFADTIGALKGPDNGKFGKVFNGGSFITIPNNNDLNLTNDFEIECWLKINDTPLFDSYVFSKGAGNTNATKQYALTINTSKQLDAYAYVGGTEYKSSGTTILSLDTWYHVIWSLKDSELSIIINGEEDSAPTSLTGEVNTTTGPLELGRSSAGGNYFIGSIDEFAIHPHAYITAGGSAYARYRSGINEGTVTLDSRFYPEQLMNGNARTSYVWCVTDSKDFRGRTITANGETYTMEDKDSYRYEHGWWSRSVSDSDAKMSFIETVVCEFDAHPTTQIDIYTSEFFAAAKEIDIYYRDTNNVWQLVGDGVIIDEFDYTSSVSLGGGLVYITGTRVDVKSIWGANDVARLEEIDPTYVTDISDDIISFNVESSRENFDSNIPIGSASANSCSLSLSNVEKYYSVYNIDGPYYNLILPDVKFEIELGWLGTEYTYKKLGTYWADEWQEDSDSMNVTVQCRDFSKFLQETTNTGNIWFNIGGADAVGNFLKEANFPAYDIDCDLSYVDTVTRKGAVGAWALSESGDNKYAVSWNEENIDQYAWGDVNNGPDGDFTLMFWIKHPNSNPGAPIIQFYRRNSVNYLNDIVRITNPSAITIQIGASIVNTGANVADNNWHQVSVSWEQSTGKLYTYVDGTLQSARTAGADTALNGKYTLILGANEKSLDSTIGQIVPKFIGSLAHIILIGKYSTHNEIVDNGFRELLKAEKDIKIYYNFNEGYLDADSALVKVSSQVAAGDFLRLKNVEFVKEDFITAFNFVDKVNATYYNNIDLHQDDSALSLEPYNKSAFFYGDKPSSLYFDGVSYPYIQTSSSSRVSIINDIDIFLRMSVPTFTPAADQIIYAQSKPSTNAKSFAITLTTTGAIKVSYSTNGSSFVDKTTTKFLQNFNVRTSEKFWLRISHDIDDGGSGNVVSVYVSTSELDNSSDISSWTLVESMITAGTVTRHSSAAPITLGSDSDNNNKFAGNIYNVYVTSGINSGDIRIDLSPSNFANKAATTITDTAKNVWDVNETLLSSNFRWPQLSGTSGSYMIVPPADSLNVIGDSFSVGLWVKPLASETYPILAKEGGAISVNEFVQALSPSFWWRFQETSGTTAYDIGSQANNGTYSGTYSLSQSGLVRDVGARAASFTNGQVLVSNNTLLNSNASGYIYKTISIWLKTGSDVNTRQVIYKQGSTDDGISFSIENGHIYASVWSSTNSWTNKGIYVTSSIDSENIYNVTLVFDGSNLPSLIMYVNGAKVGTAQADSATDGKLPQHTGNCVFGRSTSDGWYDVVNNTNRSGSTNSPFTGKIGEVIHFNEKILTDEEINLLWGIAHNRYCLSSTNKTLGTFELGLTENQKVYVKSCGYAEIFSSGNVEAGEWSFIVVAYDSENKKINIYINGEKHAEQYIAPGFIDNNFSWLLGTDGAGKFTGSGAYFNGLCIFDYKLEDADVDSLYKAGASLVNIHFPAIWTEEGESLWDAMLAVSTADLGTFYFDYDNQFVYKNALNNYSSAFHEFYEPQWTFDDGVDIISASQSISLQSNKIIVRLTDISLDLNKKENIWSAPDNTIISGGELGSDLSETFTEFIEYKTKTYLEGNVPVKTPDFLPSGYVKIDNEIIEYDRKDDVKLYGLTRGVFDTEPAAHTSNSRIREVFVFNAEYQSKPAVVISDPFITAKIYDKTVDIDKWRPGIYGAELIISRNTTGDAYLVQPLVNTDPLSNINNYIVIAGTTLVSESSNSSVEFESAEYTNSIRRYGVKQIEITNRFLNSKTAAKKYADYFLTHFLSPVPTIELAILGNPMIKLGDRVRIATLDRMGISAEDFWVESISIDYSGGINQNLILRRVS